MEQFHLTILYDCNYACPNLSAQYCLEQFVFFLSFYPIKQYFYLVRALFLQKCIGSWGLKSHQILHNRRFLVIIDFEGISKCLWALKSVSFNVWVRFLVKLQRYPLIFNPNILLVHWKMCSLLRREHLRASRKLLNILKHPCCVSEFIQNNYMMELEYSFTLS